MLREKLSKDWLGEIPWKGIPKRVTVPYSKISLRSLLFPVFSGIPHIAEFLEYLEERKPREKHPGLSGKAKYYPLTDSELVP